MKSKVNLNEKQKELVEKFKDILNQMKNENIGIIDEFGYDSHFDKSELSLYFYNKSEVEEILNIDEWDNEIYNENEYVTNADTMKVDVPINYSIVGDWYENNEKCFFVFKDEETDKDGVWDFIGS